jgi:N-terminal domain of anti-restriction factor ArdC
MARTSTQDRQDLVATLKAEFDERLAKIATDPVEWVEFIEQAALFGARYSLGNQILLMAQADQRGITPRYFLPYGNKDATTGWRKHKRHVRKGETAFKIWAPVKRRPTEQEAQQWETAGRSVNRDRDGRPAIQVVGFRLASTFELSQTDGEPFEPPTIERTRRLKASASGTAQLLVGDDPTGAYDDIVKLIKDAGYEFAVAPPGSADLGSANGRTVKAPGRQTVRVRDDVEGAQRLKTTVHELAHIRCGHLDGTRPGEDLHRGRKETEAESVAHIVCKALGLDTRAYSDAYVLGWADGDLELIKSCTETVLRVSRQIITDLTPADYTDETEELDTDTV